MGTLANSEDPYEMRHFIRVCIVCQDKIDLQRKKYNVLENITSDLPIYTMDHPDFIAYSVMENSIGLKRAKMRNGLEHPQK